MVVSSGFRWIEQSGADELSTRRVNRLIKGEIAYVTDDITGSANRRGDGDSSSHYSDVK